MPASSKTGCSDSSVANIPEFYRNRLPFTTVIERANERAAILESDGRMPREIAEQRAIREAINSQGVALVVDETGKIVLDRATVIRAFSIMCRQMANVKPTPELIPIFIAHGFSEEKARELSEAPVDEDIIHRELMQRLVAIDVREQLAAMDAELEAANA